MSNRGMNPLRIFTLNFEGVLNMDMRLIHKETLSSVGRVASLATGFREWS